MGSQNSSGKSPRKKSDTTAAWTLFGVVALLAALLAGVELARRGNGASQQEAAAKHTAKQAPAKDAVPAKGGGEKAGRMSPAGTRSPRLDVAELNSQLEQLERLLAGGGTHHMDGSDGGSDDPWRAWLLLRARGPLAPEPAKQVVRALFEHPTAPPKLLGTSARLALLAALLESKVDAQLGSLAAAPVAEESPGALAWRIEVLSLAELANPKSQSRALGLALQLGLTQLRAGVRRAGEAPTTLTVESVLSLLMLSQAVFRAAPLVGATNQDTEIRRSFASLAVLGGGLDAGDATGAVLLHAAMCESVAAYVHVQQQLDATNATPLGPALREKLESSTSALLEQLARHSDDLDEAFGARYALTLSLRALRLSSNLLKQPPQ